MAEPRYELPAGQYLSLVNVIKADAGGRTRALLTRNRLFAELAGIEPTLLTIDEEPSYPESRASWTASGYLVEPMRLLNLFETFRERTLDDLPALDAELPDLRAYPHTEELHPDGTVYATTYDLDGATVQDYRRSDGSVFVRLNPARHPAAFRAATDGPGDQTTPGVVLATSNAKPVLQWPTRRGWVTHWVHELTPGEQPVFIVCDNLTAIRQLAPLRSARHHVVHVFHNAHLDPPRWWSSPMPRAYANVARLVPSLDGLVLLSPRQREDYAMRFGRTDNLVVVPNPVEPAPRPAPLPQRDPMRFAMVCRLAEQKRVDEAVRTFALVAAAEPEARLDVFGDGPLEEELQALISSLGLDGTVVLRGYDTRARDTLWSASGFLMTSDVEGYPLATLESMSHGCPVVSYDIKYGPRDQITDGVDGFLVPPGDHRAMADRILELARDPGLVARMSEAARTKADQHGVDTFMSDWREVLTMVADRRARRGSIVDVTFDLVPTRAQRLGRRVGLRRGSGSRGRRLVLDARLRVSGTRGPAAPGGLVVTLDVVDDSSETVVAVPLTCRAEGRALRVVAQARRHELLAPFEDASATHLRLRVVRGNACWQTDLDHALETVRPWGPSYDWATVEPQEPRSDG